ncbi:choice-of-anchor M domain-containing protein [Actinotalea sp. BY-33]|uniref:Choice-of-anchor M domain-containing protein n=1 Tax=Actinotalea soli TaxID=2819234 RepID=A0A939RSQ8_9CELL|nr:choice-of-anchor M domain-containing protein [Actinotalea soli]MBO1752167.1 choice-of-anchor M domain-containing protein [Actinotalea soli]
MHTRTRVGTAAVGALALLAASFTPLAAVAAEGPPPESAELRVLSRIHTDAVSTFLQGDTFELGTKADVAEGNGTRLDPTAVLFHVDDASIKTVPAGYEFIGAVGSQFWGAPESNPSTGSGYSQLWPGFSTESVPAGAIVDDATTFTLTNLDGPGDLELFSGGGLGGVDRMWSSDEGINSFTVGRTHKHANWAFTAPGRYTLDVRATATTTGGTPLAAENTYTFVVGEMPPAVTTETTLTASAQTAVPGDVVSLGATVSPADATGWVEFLDGTTTLGHEAVTGGQASLDVDSLPLGARSITARFTPTLLNDYEPSTSAAQVVTVTEEPDGDVFGIAGLKDTYAAGEIISLRAAGVTLTDGQSLRWLVREGPGATEYVAVQGPEYVRDASAAVNGAQVAVALIERVDGRNVTRQESPWSTITVTGPNVGAGAPVTLTGIEDSYYVGDPMRIAAEHTPLTAGQTYRWVSRGLPYGTAWEEIYELFQPTGNNPFLVEVSLLGWNEVALQVLDADGTVLGQSPAIVTQVSERELQLSGARSVYRVGETIELTSDLFPARPGVDYAWTADWEPIDGATSSSLSLPVTSGMDGTTLTLSATDAETGASVAYASVTVRVTDAGADEQLVLLDSLSGHYHQGGTVTLRATADPVASDSDTYRWEWKRPDQSAWSTIPGAEAATHQVIAEQALDGTEVRATLLTADGEELATSETVTIYVDDHGAPPRQKASITGLQNGYTAGDQVTLKATVAPASVLDRWEWYVQRPGTDTPALVEDTDGTSLTFEAIEELDGASVFARLTFDDGTAYVESAPVLLAIQAGEPGEPEPEPTEPGDPSEPGEPGDPGDPGEPGDPSEPGTPSDPSDPADPSEPGTTKPTTAPESRTAADLEGIPAGGVELSTTSPRQGQVVTIALGAEHASTWNAAWMFSTPVLLGGDWIQADAQGNLAVRIPADAPTGEHRIAVYAADGTLIGWTTIEVVAAASGPTPTDDLAQTGATTSPMLGLAALLLALGGVAAMIARRMRTRTGAHLEEGPATT